VATKTRTDIQNKTFVFTIMSNSHGFHVIDRPQLVPKSTAHIMSLAYSRSTRPSFHKGETGIKAIICVRRSLLGSQEREHRTVHENSGHSFDATSTMFNGPGAY
jgi:hypothetical protein